MSIAGKALISAALTIDLKFKSELTQVRVNSSFSSFPGSISLSLSLFETILSPDTLHAGLSAWLNLSPSGT